MDTNEFQKLIEKLYFEKNSWRAVSDALAETMRNSGYTHSRAGSWWAMAMKGERDPKYYEFLAVALHFSLPLPDMPAEVVIQGKDIRRVYTPHSNPNTMFLLNLSGIPRGISVRVANEEETGDESDLKVTVTAVPSTRARKKTSMVPTIQEICETPLTDENRKKHNGQISGIKEAAYRAWAVYEKGQQRQGRTANEEIVLSLVLLGFGTA